MYIGRKSKSPGHGRASNSFCYSRSMVKDETPTNGKQPITVSQCVRLLNDHLKLLDIRIIGEVTKVTVSSKGHVYFTLKDKEESAVIDCAMWKPIYELNGIQLKSGMEVIASGAPRVYAPKGTLSIVTNTLEHVGEGALKEAYEKLRKKLSLEGLFLPERKRPLPEVPVHIGVITSSQGAVIHDFTNNLALHGFRITFIDSRVEGKDALTELIHAIRTMKKHDVDVLVIMRGGGSLESLAAFDNEAIVREVCDFPSPVIAAIGHHMDIPLVALAADVMVSTPTAAAVELNTAWQQISGEVYSLGHTIPGKYAEHLENTGRSFHRYIKYIFQQYEEMLRPFAEAERKIRDAYIRFESQLEQVSVSLTHVEVFKQFEQSLFVSGTTIDHCEKIISLHNPLRLLKKGYSILYMNGKIVTSVKDVNGGDTIRTRMDDGVIDSTVTGKEERQDYDKTDKSDISS